ncbi:eclosion hormone-like 1 [Homarus americanus]|uniref:Eclosion hormone-like 1 n=2 Tax=Nephropidae TaxID=6704 RepID=A0A8J5KE78_HOMAM|nr:eclosion hormone-like 1 [Homarus americanus]QBX89045.1 eclosion hormone 2 [Nephrops norvegicus]
MVGSRKVVVSVLLVLSVMLMALLLLPSAAAAANKVSVCIKNCAQCKIMYHDHFKGGLCADLCVQSGGKFIPDCGRPQTLIPFFLQRLE